MATEGRPLPVTEPTAHQARRTAEATTPVYVAGDARTGSSLVVNAIADAMACATEVATRLSL